MAHILVAEHDKTIADYIRTLLKKAGHTVDIAPCALDAWRACGGESYDALVIDVAMPGIDGFILAQRGLIENPDLQIIFVTGFAAIAVDVWATPVHAATPFTSRPFHLRNLNAGISALLGYGTLPSEYRAANTEDSASSVIYADFSKPMGRAQDYYEGAHF